MVGLFNGDPYYDLAVSNFSGNNISLFFGNGDGTFRKGGTTRVGLNPIWLAIGEFNNDGSFDLISADSGDNTISVMIGDASGDFIISSTYQVGKRPTMVIVNNFSGDFYPDLAVSNLGSDNITILMRTGKGYFVNTYSFTVDKKLRRKSHQKALVATNFNRDGSRDIVIDNFGVNGEMSGGNRISVFLGNVDGTFVKQQEITSGVGTSFLLVHDFDGNSNVDIIATNSGSQNLSVLTGNGDGTFKKPEKFYVGPSPAASRWNWRF